MILLRKESSVVGFIEIEHKAVIAKDQEERIVFNRCHFHLGSWKSLEMGRSDGCTIAWMCLRLQNWTLCIDLNGTFCVTYTCSMYFTIIKKRKITKGWYENEGQCSPPSRSANEKREVVSKVGNWIGEWSFRRACQWRGRGQWRSKVRRNTVSWAQEMMVK